jgi:tetratricopeptide (TPR) repeat protein
MKTKRCFSWLILILVLFSSLHFYSCGKVVPTSINWVTDFGEAKKIAESKDKNMILEFYTDWCTWCKRLADSTFTDTSVIRFSMDFVFFRANAEKDTALAESYKVNGYPTVILANPRGEEIDRIVGYATAPDFIQDISGYLRGEGTLADLENKLKADTTNLELRFRVGEKYQERKRFDEALFNFNQVISLDPKDSTGKASQALFDIGLMSMRQKDYPQAIAVFRKLVKEYPKSKLRFDAEEYVPYSYEKMGDSTQAIKLYKKILTDYSEIEPSEKEWIEGRIKKLEGVKEE